MNWHDPKTWLKLAFVGGLIMLGGFVLALFGVKRLGIAVMWISWAFSAITGVVCLFLAWRKKS